MVELGFRLHNVFGSLFWGSFWPVSSSPCLAPPLSGVLDPLPKRLLSWHCGLFHCGTVDVWPICSPLPARWPGFDLPFQVRALSFSFQARTEAEEGHKWTQHPQNWEYRVVSCWDPILLT